MKTLAQNFEAFSLMCVVDADEHIRAALRLAFYAGAGATLASLFDAEEESPSDDAFAAKVDTLIDEVDEFETTLGGPIL
jgi:hypothetical protein